MTIKNPQLSSKISKLGKYMVDHSLPISSKSKNTEILIKRSTWAKDKMRGVKDKNQDRSIEEKVRREQGVEEEVKIG